MDIGDAVPQSTKFQEGEVGEFYLPAFCAVRFGWTPEQLGQQDWDTVWGILEVLPEVMGEGGSESEEDKQARRDREYAARVGARQAMK